MWQYFYLLWLFGCLSSLGGVLYLLYTVDKGHKTEYREPSGLIQFTYAILPV